MEDKIICPQCKKITVSGKGNKYRPFCSRRCKLIDLGEWAREEKTISRNINPKEIHQLLINIDMPAIPYALFFFASSVSSIDRPPSA